MTDSRAPLIQAAGGVVVRERSDGREVLVVHRPDYDDWSLPKGKLEPGEDWHDAAVREIREETAVSAEVTGLLQPTAYLVGDQPKIVVWYRMAVVDPGTFAPNDEVDEIRWVLEGALDVLTHQSERRVVGEALAIR